MIVLFASIYNMGFSTFCFCSHITMFMFVMLLQSCGQRLHRVIPSLPLFFPLGFMQTSQERFQADFVIPQLATVKLVFVFTLYFGGSFTSVFCVASPTTIELVCYVSPRELDLVTWRSALLPRRLMFFEGNCQTMLFYRKPSFTSLHISM